MSREKYIPEDNKFIAYSKVDIESVAAAINSEVGAEVPLTREDGNPIVDSNELPDGVSMSDVKNAIKTHHPRA